MRSSLLGIQGGDGIISEENSNGPEKVFYVQVLEQERVNARRGSRDQTM